MWLLLLSLSLPTGNEYYQFSYRTLESCERARVEKVQEHRTENPRSVCVEDAVSQLLKKSK